MEYSNFSSHSHWNRKLALFISAGKAIIAEVDRYSEALTYVTVGTRGPDQYILPDDVEEMRMLSHVTRLYLFHLFEVFNVQRARVLRLYFLKLVVCVRSPFK